MPGTWRLSLQTHTSLPHACIWLLLTCVAGCAANHSIDVTRQSRLTSPVKGASFIVLLSEDEGGQTDYQDYSATLAKQLQAQGLAGVNDPGKARYAVMLERDWPHHHQASDESQDSGGGMHGGGMGGGGHHHGGGGTGGGGEDSRDTSLRIAVFDLSKPNSPQEKVFFAKAQAPIGQDENEAAVDTMIQAAMRDFPGKPHESYSVALPRTGS